MPGVAPLLPNEPASPTAFTIKINWDSSVSTAPAGFTTDVLAAVRYLETEFSDPVTITIDVGYNEIAGQSLASGDLGESEALLQPVSYTALRNALIADTKTSTDASVVQSLPGGSPVSGATYWAPTAQAKALGLLASDATSLDGYVGFASGSNFTFGDTAAGGPVNPGTYDFFATVVHELTEDMGRQLLNGENFGGAPNSYTLLDLLHYSGPGVRDLNASAAGYFSVNGGATNLGEFNTITPGDLGDWALSEPDNPFDAFATPSEGEPVTSDDLAEMDAIGWNPAGAGFSTSPVTLIGSPAGGTPSAPDVNPVTTPGLTPLVPVNLPVAQIAVPTVPTVSVSFTPETQYPATAQNPGGLLAGTALAMVDAAAGNTGDAISYALSGSGAGSFSLTSVPGGELLAAGPQAVTGASGGRLYALTVTATDETAASHPSATTAVNVVVGDSGNDSIVLASVPGIVTSAPTFIYGLGGHEILNGGQMTSALYFNSGTGNDVEGGGAGTDEYEFSLNPGEASGSVWDIVVNFRVAADRLDLTWVGCRFSGASALDPSATTIAANSIGWQDSGGNTYVYANTTGRTEALGATDMKIELQGNIPLTSGNFVHS